MLTIFSDILIPFAADGQRYRIANLKEVHCVTKTEIISIKGQVVALRVKRPHPPLRGAFSRRRRVKSYPHPPGEVAGGLARGLYAAGKADVDAKI
jgi:hypothetical protein